MPTFHPCDDGSHGCDTKTTIAVKVANECMCECLEGFVQSEDSTKRCVQTDAPTPEPTATPTHMPTFHACDDGSHGCDLTSTMAVKVGTECMCECLEGFVASPDDTKQCVQTEAPTPTPTATPVVAPTEAPTHMPTDHPCDGDEHGCDSLSTVCVVADGTAFCECLEGFVADWAGLREARRARG